MPETASITPSLAGEVWLKNIRWPFLNRVIHVQTWGGVSRGSRATAHDIEGRSVPIAVGNLRGSRAFTLTCLTGDVFDPLVDPLVEARNIDLTLAAGHEFFVHVPVTRAVPGGYVMIDTTEEDRHPRAGDNATRSFVLPCKVIAEPGPDVIGGTMTYAGMLALYGGYNAMINTGLPYQALLDLMGSPEDLVVI